MKKTIALITILVLILSCTSILFVACDKDEDETPSNSETMVTAAVMVASMGLEQASSEAESADGFEEGIDLSLNFDGMNLGEIATTAASYGFDAVAKIINSSVSHLLDTTINAASATLGNNSIEITQDTEDANIYYAKVSSLEEKDGQTVQVSETLKVTIEIADGAAIDSEEFTYSIKVEYKDGDEYVELITLEGSAKYSKTKDAIEFVFGNNNQFTAYASKDGAINLDLTLQNDEYYTTTIKVALENGNAEITAYVKAMNYGEATAVVNVGVGTGYNFAVSGTFDASLKISSDIVDDLPVSEVTRTMISTGLALLPQEVKASGNISGQAVFDTDDESFKVGLKGNVTVSLPVEE